MPLSHTTKLYAVEDAKIRKILTDPSGGTTTLGTAIDVPGIKEVGITWTLESKELRGDNSRMESDSRIIGYTLTFSHAKLNLDATAVILGGTVVDAGTTPAQTATWTLDNTGVTSYFQFEAKTPTGGVDTATGDAHIIAYKCKVSDGFDLGFAEEDYRLFSGSAVGSYRTSDGKLVALPLNETAAAIA